MPPPDQVRLRLVLREPPAGVRWALQLGRDQLVPPTLVAADRVVLETTVTLGPPASDGTRPVRGPAVQGPRTGRFLYANCGTSAGDFASPWARRAKVPLPTVLEPALVAAWQRAPTQVLEAHVAGTDRKGAPVCASVPLLEGGWTLVDGDAA
jgi:hypothetical protein